MDIHVTDRSAFKECRRKWYLSTIERLQPKSDGIGSPLWIGLSIHHALAEYYGRGTDLVEAWSKYLDVGKCDSMTRELVESMLTRYSLCYPQENWTVHKVEQELKIRIPGTRNYLVATIDLIVKQGIHYWIVDHKTCKEFTTENYLEMDDQMTAYMWVVREALGIEVRGCIYNMLKKKEPTPPPLLKNGTLSRNMALDMDRESYVQAILDNNLEAADYGDILEVLGSRPNPFFRRFQVCRNQAELNAFGNWLPHESREMASSRTQMYPAFSRNCTWCDFRILCKCMNECGDVEYMRKTLFEVKPEGVR